MVRRVQVDVGERARGQRLARQRGEAKPRPGAELQLALERGLHLPGRTRVAHGHGSTVPTAPRRRRAVPVARVAEEARGGGNAEPSDGVDLVARLGVAVGRHGPVADGLRTPARVAVGDRGQLRAEPRSAGRSPPTPRGARTPRPSRPARACPWGRTNPRGGDGGPAAPRPRRARCAARPRRPPPAPRHLAPCRRPWPSSVCQSSGCCPDGALTGAADRSLADHAAAGQTRPPSAIGGRPRPPAA